MTTQAIPTHGTAREMVAGRNDIVVLPGNVGQGAKPKAPKSLKGQNKFKSKLEKNGDKLSAAKRILAQKEKREQDLYANLESVIESIGTHKLSIVKLEEERVELLKTAQEDKVKRAAYLREQKIHLLQELADLESEGL